MFSIKKFFICVSTCITMAATISINTFAYATPYINLPQGTYNNEDELVTLKATIEGFFSDFEKDFDRLDAENCTYEKYFVADKNQETELNMAMINTFLYHRIISATNHLSGNTIRELNKELSFSYNSIDISDNKATVTINVFKTFNYNICPNIDSAISGTYSINLKKENNNWRILNISNFIPEDILFSFKEYNVDFDDISSIATYKEKLLENIQNNNSNLCKNSDNNNNPKSTTYNSSGAVSYANTYVFSPNSNYFNLEYNGGDCTNFASQVMHEGGGIPMHYGANGYNTSWFYSSPSNRSTSWAGASYLYSYMHSSNSMFLYSDTSWSSIQTGDLIQVQYTWSEPINHSMIVTGIVESSSGRADLLVTYRSVAGYHSKNLLLSSRSSSEIRYYIDIQGGA